MDTEKKEIQKVKKPTTFEKQVNILRERNLQIGDTQYAIEVLSRINYYRLSAYILSYKIDDKYLDGVSFKEIYNLYEFDKRPL